MNHEEMVNALRLKLETDFAPMFISDEYVVELLQVIGVIPKTCGFCYEPCGNEHCCMKDE